MIDRGPEPGALNLPERLLMQDLRDKYMTPDGPRYADDQPARSSLCSCVDCKCDSLLTITFPIVCRECKAGNHSAH